MHMKLMMWLNRVIDDPGIKQMRKRKTESFD